MVDRQSFRNPKNNHIQTLLGTQVFSLVGKDMVITNHGVGPLSFYKVFITCLNIVRSSPSVILASGFEFVSL